MGNDCFDHSAGADDQIQKQNEEWTSDQEQRRKRLDRISNALAEHNEQTLRQWYMNGQGQTMIVIPAPVTFWMGSPPTERERASDETLHRQNILRPYAVADKPVTVTQFSRFLLAKPKAAREFDYGGRLADILKKHAPNANCPIVTVSWFMAAHYCNWLSEQEGFPSSEWSYQWNSDSQYAKGMRLEVGRSGYRLPTEAEWEYACRAGALTSRYYGETPELLDRYAWHQGNSGGRTWPVGMRIPNDWGFFDMHGNVWQWCLDKYDLLSADEQSTPIDAITSGSIEINEESRRSRGGAYFNNAFQLRSAYHIGRTPADRTVTIGFRPARTFR
jgi:formylglycine-generating enzyme required for sulfatase activity